MSEYSIVYNTEIKSFYNTILTEYTEGVLLNHYKIYTTFTFKKSKEKPLFSTE